MSKWGVLINGSSWFDDHAFNVLLPLSLSLDGLEDLFLEAFGHLLLLGLFFRWLFAGPLESDITYKPDRYHNHRQSEFGKVNPTDLSIVDIVLVRSLKIEVLHNQIFRWNWSLLIRIEETGKSQNVVRVLVFRQDKLLAKWAFGLMTEGNRKGMLRSWDPFNQVEVQTWWWTARKLLDQKIMLENKYS